MIEGWAAAAVAATVVGAGVSAYGASTAAGDQEAAANNAQNISKNEFNTITAQEAPYLQSGYGANSQLNYLLGEGTPGQGQTAGSSTAGGFGSLNQQFNADDWKQLSPNYQFQLQQGQQGVLNGDASSQGALSGAALKDLTSYNQGLASNSFSNAFNQYQTQQNNTFNRLYSMAGLGQNAASNTGTAGVALAGQQAQAATNYGTAAAGGAVGSANALSSGLSNAAAWAQYGGGGYPPPTTDATTAGGFTNPDGSLNY